jgi:hypothetical protein
MGQGAWRLSKNVTPEYPMTTPHSKALVFESSDSFSTMARMKNTLAKMTEIK